MGKTDITHKSFFESAEWFADLMNAAFFGGEEILNAKELLPGDGAVQKADETVTVERLRDVVKKHTKDGKIYAMYVLENQSTVDYGMIIRIMLEESIEYDRQIKEIRRKNRTENSSACSNDEFICGLWHNNRLAPVFTLVLYWGDSEWNAATSLRDMVDISTDDAAIQERLLDLIPNYQVKIFDLNKVKDFSLFKTTLRTVFESYSHRKSKDGLREYLQKHRNEVKQLDEESRFLLTTIIKEKRLMKQLLKDNEREEKEEMDMCQAIEEMIAEGKAEGQNRMLLLLACMGKNNELHLVSKLQDAEFLEQMYTKYQV